LKLLSYFLIGAVFFLVASTAWGPSPNFLTAPPDISALGAAVFAGAAFLAATAVWFIANELIGRRLSTAVDLGPLRRFAAPQTGTPPATAFG